MNSRGHSHPHVLNRHSLPLASSIELANSVNQHGHAGASFPFFDIVEAFVSQSHGDDSALSFHRDKDSSRLLGLGSRFCAHKLTKGIAPEGDHRSIACRHTR